MTMRGDGPLPATPPEPARLWLVRHARPLLEPGRCYGRLDTPADAAATASTAQALAAALPRELALRCSPLRRCRQLAQALQALRPDLSYEEDARLAEMDFGAWEGRRWDDIAPAELAAWSARFSSYRVGGHGETVDEFLARVAAALEAAAASGRSQAWLTHAGVIRGWRLLSRAPKAGRAHSAPAARDWPLTAPAWGTWWRATLPRRQTAPPG